MNSIFPTLFAGLLTLSTLGATATEDLAADPIEDGWHKASLYLFKESYQRFEGQDSREARLGHAALLLLQQPKTDANLDQAVAELEKLAGDAAGPGDEPAISARYLLGRIAHAHRTPADPALAASHYRRLIAEHPDHFLADQALVKLALIEIYEPGLPVDERLTRIDLFGERAERLTRPGSRRDLHLVLATACANLRLDDTRCLRHYLDADQAGVERPILRANVTVAIGELARRLGQDELARRYFERFLDEFKRDHRRALVEDKLHSLAVKSTGENGS